MSGFFPLTTPSTLSRLRETRKPRSYWVADEFPFPIPLVNSKSGWEFDTSAGRLEILYRRIGRNESDAIRASLAFMDAQTEYAEKNRTGEGVGVYAQRIASTPGKKEPFLTRRWRPKPAW